MALVIRTTGFEEYLDASKGAWIRELIMGDPGAGKTPSAACWPKPIFADCERGLMSVADKGVPYAEINSSADMDAFLEHVRIDSLKPLESRKYLTVVIDTIDSYQRKLIAERLKKENKESFGGWADWDWLGLKMQQGLLEKLVNLKANVVVNMHTKDATLGTGDDKLTFEVARLKGDVKDSIFGDFDLIGRMETYYAAEGGERVMKRHVRWHPEPMYPALRDKSNKLPRFTEVDFTEGDYQRIFDLITAGLDQLPESTIVETLATEEDAPTTVADAPAGPVEGAKIPPAKKAAAKKATTAAAKKAAAAPAPETDPSSTEAQQTDGTAAAIATEQQNPEVPDDVKTVSPNGPGTAEAPVILTEDQLNGVSAAGNAALKHVHSPEGQCLLNRVEAHAEESIAPEVNEPVVEDTPEDAPAPEEPAKPAPAATPAAATKHCGDQPQSLVGKFDAVEGCGSELTPENRDKAQLAMVKFKTYLCNDCFDLQTKNAA